MRPRLSVTRQAVDLIKAFEGFRARAAKLDDGRWTIGYGHTHTAREGAEINERDGEALLLYDLIGVAHTLNEHVYTPLNQNQFDALASFVFNIGERAFRGSPTLRRLNEGRPLEAALAMELWRKSDLEGERIVVDALVRRRAAEKALFLRPVEGWMAAPSPVLPPKLDYDALGLIPLTTPVATRADLSGERATAEREPPPPPPRQPEPPSASENAAAAVIERLEALMAEPSEAAPTTTAESATTTAPHAPPAAQPSEPRRATPADGFPAIEVLPAKRRRGGLFNTFVVLVLLFGGVALSILGLVLAFQSQYDQVLGVSPHTAGLISAIGAVLCFAVAIYIILERVGLPRDRKLG
jgi:lysozyme